MIVRLFPVVLLSLFLAVGCATPESESLSVGASSDAPTGAEASSADSETYRLGQGDAIAIQVFDEPDLTLETAVGASGAINCSYLGDVKVAGKSPAELETHITSLLQNGYLVNPSVNVRVTQYRPFFINGEVRSPGGYPYQPGLTLDRAIALAGGLTDRASTRKMFVTKENANNSEEKRVSLDFKVQPGDTISIREGFF